MEQLKQAIIRQAEASWVDLIGFADRERFADLAETDNPFTLFPAGKTVILIGRRVTRGALRGVEEGTNLADYSMFGQSWLNDAFLSQSTYELVQFLENQGWDALPVLPGQTEQSVTTAGGKVSPDFHFAAVACGLAEIGLDGQVMTPQFGPRQRWHMIVTNAPLPPDPILAEPVCDQCGLCLELCPLQAFDREQIRTVMICGKAMPVIEPDAGLCRQCPNGVSGPPDGQGRPDRLAMFCSRTCVAHLNQTGRVHNRFRNAFRKRPAWRQDASGHPIAAGDAIDAGTGHRVD